MELLRLVVVGMFLTCAAANKKKCFYKMSDKQGIFKSPNYPFWNYPNEKECHYLIEAPSDHHVEITFHSFRFEEKRNGKLTDYLEVFDGRKKRRKQEVYYYGRIETPFTFVSITTKVIMRFYSNKVFNFKGFLATYKVIPNPTCDPHSLRITHGRKDCPVSEETGKTMGCVVTCDDHYQLHGPKSPKCAEFSDPPTCSLIPETAERCTENMTSCPYKMEEVVQYLLNEEEQQEEANVTGQELEVIMEELSENITSTMSLGRGSGGKLSKCNPPICISGKKFKRTYLIRCQYFYNRFVKMSLNQRRNRMLHCFKCQMVNCKRPVISQIF